MRYYIVR